jgi:hypothetical protein
MKKTNTLIKSFETKDTVTANGAITHSTTSNAVLDFFGMGSAARQQTDKFILDLFNAAYAEDKTLALKVLFYSRDIRGGQGERKAFRTVFKHLANTDEVVAKKLLKHIPEFGRWDDILETVEGTPLEIEALKLVSKQLRADLKSETPSLCAKWAPSEQASSDVTRRLAKKVREYMKMSPKQYRKMLSGLRAKLNILERQMCSKDWDSINFERVPSRAAMLYKDAFKKHAEEAYNAYLTKVKSGEAKINASTLYPYELTVKAMTQDDATIEAQWKALPNYLADNPHNGLVVADVSGSMTCCATAPRPIDVSISLALYFAERNEGAFNGYFMTFSNKSKLVKVTGNTLHEKVNNLSQAEWGMSTNLQSAFESILSHAVKGNVPEKDMPKTIYVISDMQFNVAVGDNSSTNHEAIKAKYKKAGYNLPSIVFWNVNASSKQSPVKMDEKGTCLVSGCSPSILKSVLSAKVISPMDVMLETINSERYESIKA